MEQIYLGLVIALSIACAWLVRTMILKDRRHKMVKKSLTDEIHHTSEAIERLYDEKYHLIDTLQEISHELRIKNKLLSETEDTQVILHRGVAYCIIRTARVINGDEPELLEVTAEYAMDVKERLKNKTQELQWQTMNQEALQKFVCDKKENENA